MKQHKHRLLLWFIGFALVACSPAAPSPTQISPPTAAPATMLPTAVPPEIFPGSWAISFDHPFPDNFWNVGDHRYGFYIDCPLLIQGSYGGEWIWFHVTEEVPKFDDPVYLRLGGLSYGPIAPITTDAINPGQATIAVVTLLGVTEEDAKLSTTSPDCVVLMRWDEVSTEFLLPGEPFQP
ncbi:MAG TPA: hypothetical protein G4O11_10710 [Anaerolineae bacterium]|nr:hypothetical protein [Anaerolineae bacterium]